MDHIGRFCSKHMYVCHGVNYLSRRQIFLYSSIKDNSRMVCDRVKIKEGDEIQKNGGRVESYLRFSCQESLSKEGSLEAEPERGFLGVLLKVCSQEKGN